MTLEGRFDRGGPALSLRAIESRPEGSSLRNTVAEQARERQARVLPHGLSDLRTPVTSFSYSLRPPAYFAHVPSVISISSPCGKPVAASTFLTSA